MNSSPGIVAQKFMCLIAGALVVLFLGVAAAHADAPYSFAGTPGKLPKIVVPLHYELELEPDLDKLSAIGHAAIISMSARPRTGWCSMRWA